jgi:hypothetical protein
LPAQLAIWAPLDLEQEEREQHSKLVLAAELEQKEQERRSMLVLEGRLEH